MAVYPYSRLFITQEHIVALSGPHIQVVNIVTGDILHSTSCFSDEQKEAVLVSGPIRCAAVDNSGKYIITAGDDKLLKLWELNGLKLLSERELPKKPTVLQFTSDGETLLAADKFGDIFSYSFTHVPLTTKQKRDAFSSHENPSGGTLILGHTSPLNAFLLSPSEKFIITADRDEHIRVSWYPKGYNIEMYCLGHRKFVSAIHIPLSDPTRLISGGGDPMLKIWDWMVGKVVHEVRVIEVVDPFMVVHAVKRKRYEFDDDLPETGRQKRKGKGKGKGKGQERPTTQNVDEAADDVKMGQEVPVEPKAEKVLVIHKIDSLESESVRHIVFSAVGTTALFAFPFMPSVQGSAIRHFNFGKPVVDFSVGDDARIWVSLDGEWETGTGSEDKRLVRVIKMVNGEFIEMDQITPIIAALNSVCPIAATADNLKKLDLYSGLTSMPKYTEVDNDSGGEEVEGDIIDSDKGKAKDDAPKSKKELGRLKSQQAVARVLEQAVGGSEAKPEDDNADIDASKRKRMKSDAKDDGDMVME